MQHTDPRRFILISLASIGLLLVYVFQRMDYLALVMNFTNAGDPGPTASFVFNRALRLITNDVLCIVLIRYWFADPTFNRLALWAFMVEGLVLLPLYLGIKLSAEGPTEISSPLFQPLHRMIVNPLLMFILMAGMYYQKVSAPKPS